MIICSEDNKEAKDFENDDQKSLIEPVFGDQNDIYVALPDLPYIAPLGVKYEEIKEEKPGEDILENFNALPKHPVERKCPFCGT